MNIETAIAQLTEAVSANTTALKMLLEASLTPPLNVLETPVSSIGEQPAAEPVKKRAKKSPAKEIVEAPTTPVVEAEETETSDEVSVPELPIDELRVSLRELIKTKMFADPLVKPVFEAARAKFKVKLVGELTDEQVPEFYKEVLSW